MIKTLPGFTTTITMVRNSYYRQIAINYYGIKEGRGIEIEMELKKWWVKERNGGGGVEDEIV